MTLTSWERKGMIWAQMALRRLTISAYDGEREKREREREKQKEEEQDIWSCFIYKIINTQIHLHGTLSHCCIKKTFLMSEEYHQWHLWDWENQNVGECGREKQSWRDGGRIRAPVIIWSFNTITLSFRSASHTPTHFSVPLSHSHRNTHTHISTSKQTHLQKGEHLKEFFSQALRLSQPAIQCHYNCPFPKTHKIY